MADHVYAESELFLLRRALTRGNSSALLMQQAKSIEELIESGIPAPIDRVVAELKWLMANEIGTYQSGQAAAKAKRCLDRIENEPLPEVPDDGSPLPVYIDRAVPLDVRWDFLRLDHFHTFPREQWERVREEDQLQLLNRADTDAVVDAVEEFLGL